MNVWLVVILVVLLALFGAPLFAIIATFALYGFTTSGTEASAVIIELYRIADSAALVAIPLFTFAGYMLAESKSPQRMIGLARAVVGSLPGGISFVVLVTCAFFTAFTGASGVTIVALGGLMLPMLIQQNYPQRFSIGLITASGSIGLLFPPSLPIILYGLIASVSIDQLFVAGAFPGLVLVGILAIYGIRVSYTAKVPRVPFVWKELWTAVRAAAWEIPLPFIVIGGIYGGAFTAIEAAAITAFYVFVVEVFVYRDLNLFRDVPRVMRESMVLVGAILAILGVALGLTNYLIDQEVPQQLFELVKTHISSPTTFLLILNGFLIIVGMMMDIFSAIIVVVPLILPISREFGIDPVHLGIIFLTNLEIGYLTPPVGLNLFLSSLRFKKPVFEIVRSVMVFILLELVALAVITYVPDLSLWLVRALGTQ